MYRSAIEDLKKWKENKKRKPLIIEGARQVGKTWLLKKFGEEFFENYVYVDLEEDGLAREIFDGSFEPERIVSRLAIHKGVEIVPGKTLIIVDEAQENPRALTALKYFYENSPEYHIIVAGSLLGITLHQDFSFPVGKVETLRINPLTFKEFLIALGKKKLAESLEKKEFELLAPFHESLIELLKVYMVVGGMPEVVETYLEDKTLLNVREVQKRILYDYERDFSKHANKFDVPRITEIFNIVPTVLAKENKKFMFGMIKQSARAREYESALLWLTDAGIATRVNRVKKIAVPLSAYLDLGAFKLFLVDVGLLGCKAGLRPETIYDEKNFAEFKGALAEQFVFQELHSRGRDVFYYSGDDSSLEIDFLIDTEEGLRPIEVKSGKNLASASLKKILEANKDLVAVKFSGLPYMENERIVNMPLYMAGF